MAMFDKEVVERTLLLLRKCVRKILAEHNGCAALRMHGCIIDSLLRNGTRSLSVWGRRALNDPAGARDPRYECEEMAGVFVVAFSSASCAMRWATELQVFFLRSIVVERHVHICFLSIGFRVAASAQLVILGAQESAAFARVLLPFRKHCSAWLGPRGS